MEHNNSVHIYARSLTVPLPKVVEMEIDRFLSTVKQRTEVDVEWLKIRMKYTDETEELVVDVCLEED